MRLFILGESESEKWDDFVAASPEGHILQSSLWGQFKAAFSWDVARLALEEEGHLLAGAQVLFRPAFRLGKLSLGPALAYVPKGPLVDWDDVRKAGILLDGLHRLARSRRAFCLKIEPEIADDQGLASRLQSYGFRPSSQAVQPRSTIWIDLRPDPEEILARMKPKTRYNIRLAERREVQVREGRAEDLEEFYRLMQLTGKRDGFAIHSRAYYDLAYLLFVPAGLARLFLACYKGEILAGLMAFAFGGKAWYFYGASSDRERQRMPNHLLQWKAMLWARERGCLIYDLWGVPDEVGQNPEPFQETQTRQGGLWGVYRFKQGFGGQTVRYLGAYDYVYSPFFYRMYEKLISRRIR